MMDFKVSMDCNKKAFLDAGVLPLVLALVCLGFAGCASSRISKPSTILGPFYKPTNFYRVPGEYPAGMRRVALLPLTSSMNNIEHNEGRRIMQPEIYSEIAKARLFEVVHVSTEKMEALTSQPAWRILDRLPTDFVEQLKEAYDCDGVIFTHLSVYRPYPPLVIGWRMALVHLDSVANNGTVVWEFDDVFNAGQKTVINGARRHAVKNDLADSELDFDFGLLNSPRRFGQYTASEVVETMVPHRNFFVADLFQRTQNAGSETVPSDNEQDSLSGEGDVAKAEPNPKGGFWSRLFRRNGGKSGSTEADKSLDGRTGEEDITPEGDKGS